MTTTLDPFDELTSMFLTDSKDEGDRRAADPASPPLEILLVGHLPVRAGLWLTPYADAVARTTGPGALVRLDGDEPMVQLLRVHEDDVPGLDSCRSLRETILQLSGVVRTWIVRPSTAMDVEDVLAAIPDPTAGAVRMTILSSADQAALVNAYRLVKTIVHAADGAGEADDADDAAEAVAIDIETPGAERPRRATSNRPRPAIGLAVIGASNEAAEHVARQLDETTTSCLGVSVPLVATLPRMDAGIRAGWLRSFLGRGRPDLGEVLSWIDSARRRCPASRPPARPVPPAPSAPPVPPAVVKRESPAVETFRHPLRAVVPDPPRPTTPESSRTPDPAQTPPDPPTLLSDIRGDRPASTEARAAMGDVTRRSTEPMPEPDVRRVKLAPKAAVEVEPKANVEVREPDDHGQPVPLARHVTGVEGLTPIPPRCPKHERVELAVDDRGAIHLLAHEDDVRELAVVAGWARAHREILSMACPNQTFAPKAPVVLHVFAATPLDVADLHGSDLRLHVLAPVEVDGRQGWYAAPLNRL